MTYHGIKACNILNILNGHSVFAQRNLKFDVSRLWSLFSVLHPDGKGKTVYIEFENTVFESYFFGSNLGLLLLMVKTVDSSYIISLNISFLISIRGIIITEPLREILKKVLL